MNNRLKIKGPIFSGRSYYEYLKMFNLRPENLKNVKILDCAAGASSFTARMNKKGFDVKAVDLLYNKKPTFLHNRCKYHLNALVNALSDLNHLFVWDFFDNLDELKKIRMKSCQEFYEDYKNNRKNYIKADLLKLPFKDNSFPLVLNSHLLFIYDHRFNYDFHKKSIIEMLRVSSKELRIYPLVKHKAIKSDYVKKIIDDLNKKMDIKIEDVDYEFRKGANEMMRIIKNKKKFIRGSKSNGNRLYQTF